MLNSEWLFTLAGIFGSEIGPLDHGVFWASFAVACVLFLMIYKGVYRALLARDTTIPSAMLLANIVLLLLVMGAFYGLRVSLIGPLTETLFWVMVGVGAICVILAFIGWLTRRVRA